MLCRQNSNASMYQKLLFIAMRTFCARASDISGVSWQNFSVERSYTDAKGILTRFPRSLTSVDFFEKKNGASKPIMLLPFNNDDALCIYVALGDNAMGGTFNLPCKANTDFETFLFPTIAGKGDGAAAAIISKSLKFFAPHIHSALDHDKTITDLSKDISSHGIRRAVIDEAGFAGASNPAVCAVSGHALSNNTLDYILVNELLSLFRLEDSWRVILCPLTVCIRIHQCRLTFLVCQQHHGTKICLNFSIRYFKLCLLLHHCLQWVDHNVFSCMTGWLLNSCILNDGECAMGLSFFQWHDFLRVCSNFVDVQLLLLLIISLVLQVL